MELEAVCCPSCHQFLDHLPDHNQECRCSNCGALYTLRGDILDFIPNDHFYWGEICQEQMIKINEQAEQTGDWYQAACQNLTERPTLIKYATDLSRMGWLFHCYDANHHQACLDVGSGWGVLSFGLSRFYDTVYSLDGVYERLRFQSIRAKIDGVHNIHFLRNNLLHIPIRDHTMDLVVLNGVLEWVGLSDPTHKPDILQKQFIQEMARVLKPDGKIYLGIENRFSFLLFLGYKDHSGLRFTSLVPRAIAHWMVRNSRRGKEKPIIGKKLYFTSSADYRFYTYSLWGYKKLFRQAGFANVTPYWAWPGYSYPKMSGSMDGISIRYVAAALRDQANQTWQRLILRGLLAVPSFGLSILIKVFAPYFLLVASRVQDNPTLLESRVLIADDDLADNHPQDDHQNHFLRLSLAPYPQLKTTYLCLDRLSNVSKAVRVKEESSSPGARSSFTFRTKPGVAGRLLRPYSKDEVVMAARWLTGFQQKTRQNTWADQQLIEEMEHLTESAGILPGIQDLKPRIQEFAAVYSHLIKLAPLNAVSEHGDFTPRNLIITSQNDLCAIDWEFFKETGNPLMDIGGFYLSLLRRGDSQRTNHPLEWFIGALDHQPGVPVSITPTYYLLRVIDRYYSFDLNNPVIKNALADLRQLFSSTLDYSLSMANGHRQKVL